MRATGLRPAPQGCEPYIVALRQDVPWYDERFRGYGRDKIVHLLHVSGGYRCGWGLLGTGPAMRGCAGRRVP